MTQEAELLRLPPELAHGTLGIELPTTKDLQHLRNVEQVLLHKYSRQSYMYTSVHLPSGPDAPGTPPWIGGRSGRSVGRGVVVVLPWKSRPTVSAWFITHISSEEDPSRPKGSTVHSNWLSCDRKLVFHLSEARIWT